MSTTQICGSQPLEEPSFSNGSPNPTGAPAPLAGKLISVSGPLIAMGRHLQGGTVKLGELQGLRAWHRLRFLAWDQEATRIRKVSFVPSLHRKYTSYSAIGPVPRGTWRPPDDNDSHRRRLSTSGGQKFSKRPPSPLASFPSCRKG